MCLTVCLCMPSDLIVCISFARPIQWSCCGCCNGTQRSQLNSKHVVHKCLKCCVRWWWIACLCFAFRFNKCRCRYVQPASNQMLLSLKFYGYDRVAWVKCLFTKFQWNCKQFFFRSTFDVELHLIYSCHFLSILYQTFWRFIAFGIDHTRSDIRKTAFATGSV